MVSCDSLTKKVSQHTESTDTEPTEGCCSRNVPIEFVDHGGLSVPTHHHLLILQLLSNLEEEENQ